MIFISGVLFIEHIKTGVTDSRTDLTCTDAENISDGTKVLCLLIDGTVPYFIIVFLSLVGGFRTNSLKWKR